MTSLRTILTLAAVIGVAACANNPNRPTDTGNMAFPRPLPQGDISTSRPATAAPVRSGIAPAVLTPDTGNMALPNRAEGNSLPK